MDAAIPKALWLSQDSCHSHWKSWRQMGRGRRRCVGRQVLRQHSHRRVKVENQPSAVRYPQDCIYAYGKKGGTWCEMVDDNSGETYYWNSATGESRWEKPGPTEWCSHSIKSQIESDEWEGLLDPRSGELFFKNKGTKALTWQTPVPLELGRQGAKRNKRNLDGDWVARRILATVDKITSITPFRERHDSLGRQAVHHLPEKVSRATPGR